MNKLQPFVKWAGGKRQLLDKIKERMPKEYNNYYEPFVGGGAVLFELQPKIASINDINNSLINTYRTIRDFPNELNSEIQKLDSYMLKDLEKNKKYYIFLREKYNQKLKNNELDIELASLFIWLNKHCFNGLYRVNSKNEFNVPYNNSIVKSIKADDILKTSDFLKNVNIFQGDFENVCKNCKKGDFVFFDSPYAPLKDDSFESYTKEGFSKENHIRLANLFEELTKQGVYCMTTNHNTDFINELYGNKGYHIDVVDVKRFINSDGKNRVGKEVIIYNY